MQWVWDCQSCRNWMMKCEESGPQESCRMDTKRLMRCCTTNSYRSFLKSFKPISSVGTTTILWLGTLVSIKPESLSAGNTIDQASKRMSRPISRAAMFVYRLKQSNTSFMATCRPCQYQPTDGKTFQCTLWPGYQFQPTGKVKLMNPS